MALDPFRFTPNEDYNVTTMWHWFWLFVVAMTVAWPVWDSTTGETESAMWGAIAVGSVMFCLVTCVKLSQTHELALLKRQQDHEIAQINLKE